MASKGSGRSKRSRQTAIRLVAFLDDHETAAVETEVMVCGETRAKVVKTLDDLFYDIDDLFFKRLFGQGNW